MSYSFNVRAASKAAVLGLVATKLDEVVQQQGVHAVDRDQAAAAAAAFVGLLPDDDAQDVQVGLAGYVSGQWQGQDLLRLSAANVSVTVALVPREAA